MNPVTKTETSLQEKANQIREDVISVASANGAGHIAPSLSCVDILAALYYEVMDYDANDPFSPARDRLIFSKGHGCYAVYSILADIGVIPHKEWTNFYRHGQSTLPGCLERRLEYGLEAGSGSLGHGLPMAVGIAFGAKLQNHKYHVFCVTGDGEFQEGTNWEALQFAVKHQLDNLTIIIDHNRLQAMDFIVNILDRRDCDLIDRLTGFGLNPYECPGHDTEKLARLAGELKSATDESPNVIVAETIKGYGLKFMENVPKFHFRLPTEAELAMRKSYV